MKTFFPHLPFFMGVPPRAASCPSQPRCAKILSCLLTCGQSCKRGLHKTQQLKQPHCLFLLQSMAQQPRFKNRKVSGSTVTYFECCTKPGPTAMFYKKGSGPTFLSGLVEAGEGPRNSSLKFFLVKNMLPIGT